jgi:type IV pilus assembly protein PilW
MNVRLRKISTSQHRRNRGFSILELMIALLLGVVVVAGIVQLFVGNSRTYDLVNAQSRLQENARYGFEFISRAARSAGYFGCAPEDAKVAKHLVGAWSLIPEYNMSEAVGGWDSNGDGSYSPNDLTTLPRSESGVNVNVHIAGNGIDRGELDEASDILVFRSVQRPVARLAETLQPAGDPVVSTPGGEPAFAVNDVVVVADCEQAALFRVTGVAAGADETTLAREVTGGGNPFENSANITLASGDIIPATMSVVGRSYGADATVGVFESTFFFVAESAVANNRGNPVDALWQKVGNGPPVELIQGISNLQVLYGVDSTAADGTPNVNQYVTIDEVADPADIVAIQVTLDVNSVDALAENDNQPLTRTFTKTISVRNAG